MKEDLWEMFEEEVKKLLGVTEMAEVEEAMERVSILMGVLFCVSFCRVGIVGDKDISTSLGIISYP